MHGPHIKHKEKKKTLILNFSLQCMWVPNFILFYYHMQYHALALSKPNWSTSLYGSLYVCICIINYYSKSYTNTMQNSSSYNLPTAILTKSPNSFIHLAKKIKIKILNLLFLWQPISMARCNIMNL